MSTYVQKVTVPTLIVQGQKDTLFNLQEAVATYKSLQAQGTPTKMVWQSWGHSGSTPAPGELDFGAASIKDSYLGRRFLSWMDHYVRGNTSRLHRPGVRVLPQLGEVRHLARQRGHGGRRRVQDRRPPSATGPPPRSTSPASTP